MSSSFHTFVHSDLISLAKVSNLSKIQPVVAEIYYFYSFEVIFHCRSSSVGGHLPLEVIFRRRSSSFDTFVHSYLIPVASVSNWSKIRPVVADIFYFSYFEVVFHWRSSSFDIIVHSGLTPFWLGSLSLSLKFE